MSSRIVGGRIQIPLKGRQVAVFIALYWGDDTAKCHFCQEPKASVIHCFIEYGARPSDNKFIELQTPEETSAAFELVADAFFHGRGLCTNCYDIWQGKSHDFLRKELGGDWDRETVTHEQGNSGTVYSHEGAMAEVRQEIFDAAILDGAIVLTIHYVGGEHYGNVWSKSVVGYVRLLPEHKFKKVERVTTPFDCKLALIGECNRYLAAVDMEEANELPYRLLIQGLRMKINSL